MKSECCCAPVKISMSPDFIGDDPKTMEIGTCCYICPKCLRVCDVIYKKGHKPSRSAKQTAKGM